MLTLFLVLAFAASMAGGLAPSVEGFLERVGPARILSFRSGLLIAVAVADVLPEAWREARAPAALACAGALLLGWRLHQGHAEEHEGHELTHPHVHSGIELHGGVHLPAALAALFLHSLIDGLNLGATALVGGAATFAVGAATSVHKLADGFTLTSLFHGTRRRRGGVLALLFAVSLMTPVGALLGRAGTLTLGPALAAPLLGFAGGSFLFVGAIQILPRLRRRPEADSALAFAGGFLLMLVLRRLAE